MMYLFYQLYKILLLISFNIIRKASVIWNLSVGAVEEESIKKI